MTAAATKTRPPPPPPRKKGDRDKPPPPPPNKGKKSLFENKEQALMDVWFTAVLPLVCKVLEEREPAPRDENHAGSADAGS